MLSEREIFSYLLNCGIKVRPNAIASVKSQFYSVSSNPEELEKLIVRWSKLEMLDLENIEDLSALSQDQDKDPTEISVIDSFKDLAKQSYSSMSKKCEPCRERPSYLTAPTSKVSMHVQRFLIALDRIKQHPNFKSEKPDACLVNSIDSLIGCRGERIVVGVLTRTDGNQWVLEDLNSSIKLEFTNCERNSGFFCEGCIVLVQGQHFDGLFKVFCIAQPPVSFLPAPFPVSSEKWTVPWADHSLIVLISNVHLDDPRVMVLLSKIFEGYSKFSNVMFVLIGNFSSQKMPNVYNYRNLFANLVSLIEKYEMLKETAMWVFIPGPNDPGLGEFMPREAISLEVVDSVSDLKKWKLASNPSRLSFCDKKIMIVRTENLRKMQRSTAIEPNYEENPDPEAHLAHTLLKQAHVCPTSSSLVLPDYDYALRIDHSLDFLCVAESTKSFVYKIDGVTVFNPGHFSRYSSFVVLSGKDLNVEQCSLEE